jgi:hypothetical protein
MQAIAALQPDMYVALADEVRASILSSPGLHEQMPHGVPLR